MISAFSVSLFLLAVSSIHLDVCCLVLLLNLVVLVTGFGKPLPGRWLWGSSLLEQTSVNGESGSFLSLGSQFSLGHCHFFVALLSL